MKQYQFADIQARHREARPVFTAEMHMNNNMF